MPLPPPEDYARALLSRLRIKQPVNLETVASALGLQVRNVDSTGFDGALTCLPGIAGGTVAVRSSMRSLERERFTIAHEIGHYVLPGQRTMSSACSSQEIETRIKDITDEEVGANRFASELLLPTEQISLIVCERGASVGTVKFIARTFRVSLIAAALQCMVVTHDACAVVVSVDGIVRFYKTSRSWRYFIPVGRKIRDGTVAAGLDLTLNEATGVVKAIGWTTNDRMTQGADIVENSIYLPPYNTTLTILTAIGY